MDRQVPGKLSGVRDYVSQTLSNQKLIQFISILSIVTAMSLLGDSAVRIILDDNTGVAGVTHLFLNIYAMILSVFMFSCEFSFSQQNSSRYGQRIVEYLPFLRTRYGRSIIYAVSAIVLMIFNNTEAVQQVSHSVLLFCGVMYGIIAMQPDNPLDYRGFQRPQDNFLSRFQSMGAQSFDQMAAQYISLSSSQYLNSQAQSDSQQIQDQVLAQLHGGVELNKDEESKQQDYGNVDESATLNSTNQNQSGDNIYQAPQDPQWGGHSSWANDSDTQHLNPLGTSPPKQDNSSKGNQSSSYELDNNQDSQNMDFNK